ncbi:MAG: LacI family transcriptional regulator [Caldilineaceae bacterium]|nr:LacI family transcriptional regulator [Caldilineaceae bacterium]
MQTKKRISIKDIADAAGVSHPTVSRALRGEGRMSGQTRSRIVALAQEMGYTPSLVARGLVTQRSHSVGLVVTSFVDPFHSEVAQGVEDEARRRGYSLFLASTGVDALRELEVVDDFQGRQVDGIIVSSSRVGNQYRGLLKEIGIPIVLINTHADGENVHSIYHDDYHGGRQLMQHLLDRGYRRIAYLGNRRAGRADSERERAWVDAMHAVELDPALTVKGPNGRLHGGAAGAELLLRQANDLWNSPPEAIYCYNDTVAIGAASVLRRNGLRVPSDVALTGFDDIDVAAYVDPPLTTLHQPRTEMGALAMRLMLALLDDNRHPPVNQTTILQGTLVVRESS